MFTTKNLTSATDQALNVMFDRAMDARDRETMNAISDEMSRRVRAENEARNEASRQAQARREAEANKRAEQIDRLIAHATSPAAKDLEKTINKQGEVDGLYLRGEDLRGVDLTNAVIRNSDLTGADLRGAKLAGATITDSDLTGADLRGADLTWTAFHRVTIEGANLEGANTTYTQYR